MLCHHHKTNKYTKRGVCLIFCFVDLHLLRYNDLFFRVFFIIGVMAYAVKSGINYFCVFILGAGSSYGAGFTIACQRDWFAIVVYGIADGDCQVADG